MLNENDVIKDTYQIVREIGAGGMGVIYLAYHLSLRKYVVIKRIKDDFVGRIEARGEVDIMKNLSHSYLPHIYDFIQIGNEIYTVMSYIEGSDFSVYVRSGCRFSEEQITRWLSQCLEVLDYLHSGSPAIIHRDIKPGNIMLDTNGNICLIDFNISLDESKGTGINAMSKAYASPEQLHPEMVLQPDGQTAYRYLVDRRTDIYSLGVTFYHIMTGIKPHEGIGDVYPITELDVEYSEALRKIIAKAMSENPDDRYQTAGEMLTAVKNIYKTTAAYRLRRAGIIAAVCTASVAAGVTIVTCYKISQKKKLSEFQRSCSEVLQIPVESSPDRVIEEAVALLNDDDYDSVYDKYPDRKGTLLYQVALAYFEQGNYAEANEYFESAVECADDSEYIRDYAISLAKNGDTGKAGRVLDRYGDSLDESDERQIRAELAFVKGDYQTAETELRYVIDSSTNLDDRSRCLLLLGEIYEAQGRYDEVVQLMSDATVSAAYETAKEKLLANAYISLAAAGEESEDDYYEKAESELTKLGNSELMDLDSTISLIVVYLNTGRLDEAEQLLERLMEVYPDNYRVLVQRCFLEYNRQIDGLTYNFANFKRYYEEAMEAYDRQRTDGDADENVEKLRQVCQQLKDKGY